MANKAVAISAGEAHTLALTADGSVFCWGRGTFGRLGIGKDEDQPFPTPIQFNRPRQTGGSSDRRREKPSFMGIAAGAYHSLALEDDGTLWSWGQNTYGQLGHGRENSSIPRLVDLDLDASNEDSRGNIPLKVISIKAGGMTSLAIDSLGGLWMWGNCPPLIEDEEVEFSLISFLSPVPVGEFYGRTVVKVACGNEHVVALVSAGETFNGRDLLCYSWGKNNHGQLGLGDTRHRAHPQLIVPFNEESPWSVYDIACGAFHTALLTQGKSDEEIGCKCWTFGLGENGQLGNGTVVSSSFPKPVPQLPQDAILISLDCGLFHTCVVSAAGDVWSWGMERGLGLCPEASRNRTDGGDALFPLRIRPGESNGVRFVGPVQVACGAAHTILVAGEGYKLWAWGRGRSGVLGRGNTADSYVPSVIAWPPPDENSKYQPSETKARHSTAPPQVQRYQSSSDQRSSTIPNELELLRSRLVLMERYASLLHVSIFGRPFEEQSIPQSLQDSNYFDIKSELEKAVESADDAGLARMEAFYRNMLKNVKNVVMKRRIQEVIKEYLNSTPKESNLSR